MIDNKAKDPVDHRVHVSALVESLQFVCVFDRDFLGTPVNLLVCVYIYIYIYTYTYIHNPPKRAPSAPRRWRLCSVTSRETPP